MSIFKDKVILITGGTGSFGKACVKKLLEGHDPHTIRVYSRDELKQWEMAREFGNHPKLRFLIGDVRDGERLKRATEGVDFLIHAAALKHVPACEYNPIEAIRTNIDGAINVINAALDNRVKKVVALSTDKAVNPVNTYGATKLASDRLFIQSNSYRGGRDTRFSVVRYGNVMGSRGSVIPLFKTQRESGILTITDPAMTRFWITLPQAVDFVLSSFELMDGGELYVPKIPTMKITDLAKVIAPEAKLKVVGIRPGEKLHESLITAEEGQLTREMRDRYVVLSASRDWHTDEYLYQRYKKVPKGFQYDSLTNKQKLSPQQMQALLKELDLA
jgi:UDP-N-acetylglucosamine 4,6-dehydratase/5-epimerase